MKWFKFYGQDFITDPKMRMLTVEEKMCWVILMCLANSEDKNGLVSFVNESEIMRQVGIGENTESWKKTIGFLDKFEELKMVQCDEVNVTRGKVTDASRALYRDVTLINFGSRQDTNLDSSERQRRYRERLKIKTKSRNDSNVTQRNDSNARVDKSRLDKNRIERESDSPQKDYLENIPNEDMDAFISKYGITKEMVLKKAEGLKNYCEMHGKRYKNYKAFLNNALLRDFGNKEDQQVKIF